MDEETTITGDGVVSEEVTETEEDDKTPEIINTTPETSETEGDEDSENDEEEVEPEYDEFDFGGEKLQVEKGAVPDELKERLDKFTKGTWSDYTKKSQAIAEQTKELEAREQAVQKLGSLQGEAMDTYARGVALKGELAELNQIDMESLYQSDRDQWRRISDLKAAKQQEFNQTVALVDQKDKEFTQAQANEAKRIESEGRKLVERQIKGFGAKADEVVNYAVKTFNIPEEQAKNWGANPVAAITMYKAMLYDRMQSKVGKATKVTKKTVEEPTPIKAVKGKGAGKGVSNKPPTDPEKYRAWYTKKYGN